MRPRKTLGTVTLRLSRNFIRSKIDARVDHPERRADLALDQFLVIVAGRAHQRVCQQREAPVRVLKLLARCIE